MEYVFLIFSLGVMVTMVVLKGIFQARKFVADETKKQFPAALDEID